MVTFLEKIKRSVQKWYERRAQNIEAAREARLDAESRTTVQVMEYNGDLFICVNGVPLIEKDDLNRPLTETVARFRGNYMDFMEEQQWKTRMTVIH